jgi:hypothetical protein
VSGQSAEARTAAMFTHEGYRYTVVMIANGAVPKTTEAAVVLPAGRPGERVDLEVLRPAQRRWPGRGA